MDNSPRWDSAYANVVPGRLPEYQRADNAIVTDASQRPSDLEYDRYLWLLEEMKSARYDDELLPKVMSFAVEDVFVSAILAVACDVLAEIGEDYKRPRADVRARHQRPAQPAHVGDHAAARARDRGAAHPRSRPRPRPVDPRRRRGLPRPPVGRSGPLAPMAR